VATVTRPPRPLTPLRVLWLVVAVAVLAASPATHAQPQLKPARVGILYPTSPNLPQHGALRQALRDLGYREGENLFIEERAAEGKPERLAEVARDLVRRNVDVIVTFGPEATLHAARQATRTIPIVMLAVDYDPIALGYVANLARPGGNITGLYFQQLELTAKRLELLKDAVPAASQVAVLWDRFSADQWRAAQAAAPSIGVQLQSLELRDAPYDYSRALQAVTRGGSRALLVSMSPVFFRDRARIAELAAAHRLPTIFGLREWAESGGLMAYGANISAMYARAATYIDRILKGANPAELPIEQPTKFELAINQKAARALGLTIPASLLLRADLVIE
jgi:putative ABC transport system substrate-binding protein